MSAFLIFIGIVFIGCLVMLYCGIELFIITKKQAAKIKRMYNVIAMYESKTCHKRWAWRGK